MKIIVTEQDISRGKPAAAESCMIAIALTRAGFIRPSVDSGPSVGDSRSYFDHGHDQENRVFLPDFVGQKIEDFDAGKPVEPFEFEVDA